MALDLSSLKKTIDSMKRSITITLEISNARTAPSNDLLLTLRAGVIQNFEFTYENCWKFMKRYLEDAIGAAAVDGVPRRELFRIAAENHLITDVDRWMDYHFARNRTAYTYQKETADEVYETALRFIRDAEDLLTKLELRNDSN